MLKSVSLLKHERSRARAPGGRVGRPRADGASRRRPPMPPARSHQIPVRVRSATGRSRGPSRVRVRAPLRRVAGSALGRRGQSIAACCRTRGAATSALGRPRADRNECCKWERMRRTLRPGPLGPAGSPSVPCARSPHAPGARASPRGASFAAVLPPVTACTAPRRRARQRGVSVPPGPSTGRREPPAPALRPQRIIAVGLPSHPPPRRSRAAAAPKPGRVEPGSAPRLARPPRPGSILGAPREHTNSSEHRPDRAPPVPAPPPGSLERALVLVGALTVGAAGGSGAVLLFRALMRAVLG